MEKSSAYNFTKSSTPLGVFSKFFKLGKWYQIVERIRRFQGIIFIVTQTYWEILKPALVYL